MSEITLTDEMTKALDLVENTTQHVLITGKAGTGKTTFLKHMISSVQKNFVVTAPTGIAAINAGGITLHSLLKIPFGFLSPQEAPKGALRQNRKDLLRALDVLVIDEISMVRADVMDFIDKRLQKVRKSKLPFGGVQLVMFGDLFQLPPVVTAAEDNVLSVFYDGHHFFHAKAFQETGFNVVELNHIFRQSDPKFIDILNNIRTYNITDDDIEDLAELRDKYESSQYDNTRIHICSFKKEVEKINNQLLGDPSHSFGALVKGDFPDAMCPCSKNLQLRIGARVMTLINKREDGYCNGSLGVVSEINENSIKVQLDEGGEVTMPTYTWNNVDYEFADGKVVSKNIGSFTQYPVTLAWAITIHKSQGLTFDNVVIHTKGVFCPGQIYVALSRCRSMEGIVSDSFIGKRHIIVDKDLLMFEKHYKKNGNYYTRNKNKQ